MPDIFARIKAIGAELDLRLRTTADESPEPTRKQDPFDLAFDRLRRDVDKAGTFLYRADDSTSVRKESTGGKATATWSEWHDEAVDRLRYLDSLLMIRDRMLKAESSIVERTSRATVMPVIRTFVGMKEQLADCKKRADTGARRSGSPNPDAYSTELSAIKDELASILRSVFRDLPGLVSSDQALSEP
ncbi:MAG: hypothetical protein R3282_10645, partial [Rhodothermales bacterium]|nr:hypothetical protein [Rhodothermales bacterium]